MDNRATQAPHNSSSTQEITSNDLLDEILIECHDEKKYEGQSFEANEHSDIGNFAFSLFLESLADTELKTILETLLTPVKKKINTSSMTQR